MNGMDEPYGHDKKESTMTTGTSEPIKFPTAAERIKVGAVSALSPRGALILVEKCDVNAQTEGGIALPEDIKRDYLFARIKKTGPGRKNMNTDDLNPGDVVMYQAVQRQGPHIADKGLALTVDGIECLLLNETDILAVVTKFEDVNVEDK